MSEPRSVAVIGASNDRRKYGNKAVRAYRDTGWRVFPVNPNETEVEDLPTCASVQAIDESVHTVSMYVPASVGVSLLEGIAAIKPAELWINPGAESPELLEKAKRLGLNTIQGCSILAQGRTPSQYPD